ncbi:MAG: hypothetical protein GX144_12205 [Clostridiaceae bacterium]|nr:hypothetical protein [Clostridiaceae bacterium]
MGITIFSSGQQGSLKVLGLMEMAKKKTGITPSIVLSASHVLAVMQHIQPSS